ncbi:MAG: hypothetical protein JSU80_07345 [Deltaproteobacteria bacterium]|nr:MAG: hypothetical protein JSU80_07345 [Deltaproteobacteria bacterium]
MVLKIEKSNASSRIYQYEGFTLAKPGKGVKAGRTWLRRNVGWRRSELAWGIEHGVKTCCVCPVLPAPCSMLIMTAKRDDSHVSGAVKASR